MNKTRKIAYHRRITVSVAGTLREFIPDVKPITVVTIDTLTTDFNINLGNHCVAEPVQPTELLSARNGDTRKSDLKIYTVD